LHLLSLQPSSSRLGLPWLVVKTSVVDLQFSQRKALTSSFDRYPLRAERSDFSLKELNKRIAFLKISSLIISASNKKHQMLFKWVCDCKQTTTLIRETNATIYRLLYQILIFTTFLYNQPSLKRA